MTSLSEPLETKQLPEDGKDDQHKRVDHHDGDQFVAAFLASDGSAHGSSPFATRSILPASNRRNCRRALIARWSA